MVAAGVVVADQRHDALGEAEGNLKRNVVDLLGDAQRRHGAGAIGRSEIVEDGHAGHVEQILDAGRESNAQHPAGNAVFDAELAGINADQRFAPAHHKQNEKVDAGHTVGQKGGASGPRRPHVQALGQNEDGVEDHVENTPAHGADAGVQAGALRPDQIGHDHIENGGHRAQADRPAQIAAGGATGDIGGAQHPEQRAVEADAEQRDERPARHGAPEAEGRGAADGLVILEAQGSAHQTGAAHAEQIVHRVECQ